MRGQRRAQRQPDCWTFKMQSCGECLVRHRRRSVSNGSATCFRSTPPPVQNTGHVSHPILRMMLALLLRPRSQCLRSTSRPPRSLRSMSRQHGIKSRRNRMQGLRSRSRTRSQGLRSRSRPRPQHRTFLPCPRSRPAHAQLLEKASRQIGMQTMRICTWYSSAVLTGSRNCHY
jgi:hypothetical protein